MKKITLLELHISNFKGIESLNIQFSEGETNITGDNRRGKTTIFDAFSWLMFGKDSFDNKDFEIKNTVKTELNRLPHFVSGLFDIDGTKRLYKRILTENWVKKKGYETEELSGNITKFEIDNVPCATATEFKSKVEEVINEQLFKLITSPKFFNSLNWKDQRKVLNQMAGTITDLELATGNEDLMRLLKEISGTPLEDYKKKLAVKKTAIKNELDTIPSRLEELNNSLPAEEINYDSIATNIDSLEKELVEIDNQIEDGSKALQSEIDNINEKKRERFNLQNELTELKYKNESAHKDKIRLKSQELVKEKAQISKDLTDIEISDDARKKSLLESEKERLVKSNDELRKKFHEENEKTFVFYPKEKTCPTCKRDFDGIENKEKELKDNFNKAKIEEINKIEELGISNAKRIEEIDIELKSLEDKIIDNDTKKINLLNRKVEIDNKIKEIESEPLKNTEEIISLSQKIETFFIPELSAKDNSELKTRKSEINQELKELNMQLGTRETIAATKKRIEELTEKRSGLNQELSYLERSEFSITSLEKKRIEEVEKRVNDKFNFVKWKMFDKQINGGESETCECTLDGIPYSTLNTEAKLNAGIDIINALCNFYGVSAPIFIDNREGVTEIFKTSSQVINLIKVTGQNELLIS